MKNWMKAQPGIFNILKKKTKFNEMTEESTN